MRPADDRESARHLLVDAFNLYDRDNSGSICRDELRDVLRATGKNPTEGKEGHVPLSDLLGDPSHW